MRDKKLQQQTAVINKYSQSNDKENPPNHTAGSADSPTVMETALILVVVGKFTERTRLHRDLVERR